MLRYRFPALIAVLALSLMSVFAGTQAANADVRSGQYSLGLTLDDAQRDEGGETTLRVSIEHSGMPNYQAVQWAVEYDENIVSVQSMDADAAAPEQCGFTNDSGTVALLGCIDLTGSNIGYSGIVYNLRVRCEAGGAARFVLADPSGNSARTFVKIGTTSQEIHTHDSELQCGGAPPEATTTATPTNVPAGPQTPAPGGSTPPPGGGDGTGQGAGTPGAGGTTVSGPDTGTARAGSDNGTPSSTEEAATATARSGVANPSGTPDDSRNPTSEPDDDDGGGSTWWIVAGVAAVAAAVLGGGALWYRQYRMGR
jgi:hypothetical protein